MKKGLLTLALLALPLARAIDLKQIGPNDVCTPQGVFYSFREVADVIGPQETFETETADLIRKRNVLFGTPFAFDSLQCHFTITGSVAVMENRNASGLIGYTIITRFMLSITALGASVHLTNFVGTSKELDLGPVSFTPVYDDASYSTLGSDPKRVKERIKEMYQSMFDDFLLEWRTAQSK